VFLCIPVECVGNDAVSKFKYAVVIAESRCITAPLGVAAPTTDNMVKILCALLSDGTDLFTLAYL